MQESSDSMYLSIVMLENRYDNFTWSWQNSQEIVNFVPVYFGSPGFSIKTIFKFFSEFGSLQVKLLHMFSNKVMEEYMEFFLISQVAK